MMQDQQNPLILTLRLDAHSQAYFNNLRSRFFPPELNFVKAHLTMFHQLPNVSRTLDYFADLHYEPFEIMISGLRHLGAGVAYTVESDELQQLHSEFSRYFADSLIPQDRQKFKPHITIQNKVTPEVSRKLLALLNNTFEPFKVQALGIDLWEYLGRHWRHSFGCLFKNQNNNLYLPKL